VRCDDASDASGVSNLAKPVQDGIDGVEDMHQRYQFYSLLLSSSSAPSFVDISSAATDEDIFADDEYDCEDRLRGTSGVLRLGGLSSNTDIYFRTSWCCLVCMPHTSKRLFKRYFPLPSSDSGFSLDAERNSWRPIARKEDVQTTRTLSPFAELVPSNEQQSSKPSFTGSNLQLPAYQAWDRARVDRKSDLVPLSGAKKQLGRTSHGEQTTDTLATPKTSGLAPRQRNIGFYGELLDTVPDDLKSSPPAPILKSKPYDLKRQLELESVACDTCEAVDKLYTRTRMSPCGVSNPNSPCPPRI
jgi:hypothetical protein